MNDKVVKQKADSFATEGDEYTQGGPYVIPEISEAFAAGVKAAEEDIRVKLLKFFADNITHGSDRGLLINIMTYTDLINKCSEALDIELMPILKR